MVPMRLVLEFFSNEAPKFRHSPPTIAFVTRCEGVPITSELVDEFLKPFMQQLGERFPPVSTTMERRLTEFANSALDHIQRNRHMNEVHAGENTFNERTADAIIVGYANHACAPMDLGMYTSDLYKKAAPT